ncbi:NIN-like protein [Tanacetum coccineum]
MLSWLFPKHKKRTVDVADSKLSRKSKSSQNLQLSLGAPFSLFDVVLLLVRIKRWRKRNAIQYAMQNNDLLVMSAEQDNNKASLILAATRKENLARAIEDESCGNSSAAYECYQKGVDITPAIAYELIQEINAITGVDEAVVANKLETSDSEPKFVFGSLESPKLIQAPVVISTSVEAPTSVVAASNEPVVTTNITHDRASLVFHQQEQKNLSDELAQFKKTMREQFIENATASAVKNLTIKATYKENMVKFPFTLLDGLEKLKEMVATRYQLKLGSFKLKYVDEDDDMILIACDTDLMLLIGDPGQPINQHATKLLVLPIAHA